MQLVIFSVSSAILYWTRVWTIAGTFLLTMQLGALVGALWAARLKRLFERQQLRLP